MPLVSRSPTPPGRGSNQPISFHSLFALFPSPLSPVTATRMPMMVMVNSVPTFKNIIPSLTRAVSRVEMIFNAVTERKHSAAVILFAHTLGSGLSVSMNEPNSTPLMYSPEIIATIAEPPGFNTTIAAQENRNPASSPKQCRRYTPLPPFSGIAPPSSAYDAAPVQASRPATAQTISDTPGDGTWLLTWLGDEKMPEPICRLISSERPFRKVSVFCRSSPPMVPDPAVDVGAPSGWYREPSAEEVRGTR